MNGGYIPSGGGGAPSGSAGGDLSGTYPNPGVAQIAGVIISGTPNTGNIIVAVDATTAVWSGPAAPTLATTLAEGADGNEVDQTNLGSLTLAAGKVVDLATNGAALKPPAGSSTSNPTTDSHSGWLSFANPAGGPAVNVPYYS